MTSNGDSWWAGRVIALVMVVVAATIAWRAGSQFTHADPRPIFIRPGEYLGPKDQTLDPAQVQAITERAQQQNY
jgi:hypothetical protein